MAAVPLPTQSLCCRRTQHVCNGGRELILSQLNLFTGLLFPGPEVQPDHSQCFHSSQGGRLKSPSSHGMAAGIHTTYQRCSLSCQTLQWSPLKIPRQIGLFCIPNTASPARTKEIHLRTRGKLGVLRTSDSLRACRPAAPVPAAPPDSGRSHFHEKCCQVRSPLYTAPCAASPTRNSNQQISEDLLAVRLPYQALPSPKQPRPVEGRAPGSRARYGSLGEVAAVTTCACSPSRSSAGLGAFGLSILNSVFLSIASCS